MPLIVKTQFETDSESWIFEIAGELDLETSSNFKNILNDSLDQKMANIVLDCSELTFIDSTGLGVLINTYKKIKDDNYVINIKNPKQNVNKLLNITGLNTLFVVS